MKNIVYENKILKLLLKHKGEFDKTNIFKYENYYTLCDIELTYMFNKSNLVDNKFDFDNIGVEHFKRDSYVRVATQFLLKIRSITEQDINRLITKYCPNVKINESDMKIITSSKNDLEDIINLFLRLKEISPFIANLVFSKHFNMWLNETMNLKVIVVIPFTHHISVTSSSDKMYEAIITSLIEFINYNQELLSIYKLKELHISNKFKDEIWHYIMLNNVFTKKSIFKFFNIDEKTVKKIINNLVDKNIITLSKFGTWIYCHNNKVNGINKRYKKYL